MKRLLVLSVYAPGTWALHEVQAWFLRATTEDFLHVVVSPVKPPMDCEWLKSAGPRHRAGLRASGAYARAHKDQFRSMCLLDSDAFPVRADWQDTLDHAIKRHHKDFAAPVRVENYDLFPHVSCIYATSSEFCAISGDFRYGRGRGINQERIVDMGAGLPLYRCLALLKSNVWSPHYRWHTIYGDIIYHCGAGTRSAKRPKRGTLVWECLVPTIPKARTGVADVAFVNKLLGKERFRVE